MIHTDRPFTMQQKVLGIVALLLLVLLVVSPVAEPLGKMIWRQLGSPEPTIVFTRGYRVASNGTSFIVSGTSACPKTAPGIAIYGPDRLPGDAGCVVIRPNDAKVYMILHGDGGVASREWVTVLHRPRRAGEDPEVVELRRPDGSLLVPTA